MKIDDLIRRSGLKMTYRPGPDSRPGWEAGASHWSCTLRVGTERMRVTYSKGPGHHGKPPTLREVLECLSLDSIGVENARSFEDWCAECGDDPETMTAHRLYERCKRQRDSLKRVMGSDYENTVTADYDAA